MKLVEGRHVGDVVIGPKVETNDGNSEEITLGTKDG